jgi:hypothetical protein
MEERLRPNEINLFGQRFHACVGISYIGLGFIFAGALHRWVTDSAAWLSPIGMLMLVVGALWWGALWWRQRKTS